MKTKQDYLELLEKGSFFNNLIDFMMSKKPQDNRLVTPAQQKFACKETLEKEFSNILNSAQHGFELLRSRLKHTYPKLQQEIDALDKESLEQSLNSLENNSKIKEGLAGWQILGISRESVEKLHSEAVALYTEKHFDDASDAFEFLITLNHWDPRCWIGYGLSQQFSPKHNLNRALDAYFIAIGLDVTNPYPYIYYAEGLAELGETKPAIEYLDLALKYAGQSNEYTNLKPLIENIKTKMKIKK